MRAYATTEDVEEALADAESRLDRKGHTPTVRLRPNKIKTMPVLFQPRAFSYDGRSTDHIHVRNLTRAIGIFDKIEPMLVIKLKRTGFVIVDGHHTLEAYQQAGKGDEEIECEWFGGTVREAWDQSCARNAKDKLPVRQEDKMQAAWHRVLLDDGTSKRELHKITGVSPRQIGYMRGVKAAAEAQDAEGERFRKNIREHGGGRGLKGLSWKLASVLYQKGTLEEVTEAKQAARLARRIQERMQDDLRDSARITALALNLYEPGLMRQLIEAWTHLQADTQLLTDAREESGRLGEEFKRRSDRLAQKLADNERLPGTIRTDAVDL